MAKVDYRLDGHVAVLTLNDGENRFNPPFLHAFLDTLTAIENDTDARTLVVTSSHEKIFSNGIDLEWLAPVIASADFEKGKSFFYLLNRLFKRLVTYPLVTVAAISGHAFAGGAILCCAFDFRFMRSDRGFFCFPEVDLGIPFLPGMNALLRKAIPRYQVEEMQYTGCRLTAEQCEAHHIVRKACHRDDLAAEALQFAKSVKKNRVVIAELKQRLNRDIVQAIDVDDPPYIESCRIQVG